MNNENRMALVITGGHEIQRVLLVPAEVCTLPNMERIRMLLRRGGHELTVVDVAEYATLDLVERGIAELDPDS